MLGTFKSYEDVIQRSFTYCKEGACLESQEVEVQPYCSDSSMPQEWCNKLLIHASKAAGRSLEVEKHMRQWYKEPGSEDITERVFRAPIRDWKADS